LPAYLINDTNLRQFDGLITLTLTSTEDHNTVVADTIGHLKRLEELRLEQHTYPFNIDHHAIKGLVNLTSLSIDNTDGSRITGDTISSLTKLRYLELDKLSPSLAGAIKYLTNLQTLSISCPREVTVDDIYPLCSLKELCMYGDSPITRLRIPSLLSLVLKSNQSVGLDAFHDLKVLRRLDISGCVQITNSHLYSCPLWGTNLQWLNINDTRLLTDDLLCKLTNLIGLQLDRCPGITGESFDTLSNLIQLSLRSNNMLKDGNLAKLTQLTHLTLSDNKKITDKSICVLTNLQTLYCIGGLKVTSKSLNPLTNLTYLALEKVNYFHDQGFKPLISLKHLSITNSKNISGCELTKLTNLTYLKLEGFKFFNVSHIHDLTNLTTLDIRNTRIKLDINTFSLPNLTCLGFMKDNLTSSVVRDAGSIIYNARQISALRDWYTNIDTI
jgi:hypothetical protein